MQSGEKRARSHVVIVGTRATVVIERAATAPPRQELQAAIEGDEPIVRFLSRLTANGVRDLPEFAYVGRESESVRVLLRGDLVAIVRKAGGTEVRLSAGSVSTWSEVAYPDCIGVEIRSLGDESDVLAAVSFAELADRGPPRHRDREPDLQPQVVDAADTVLPAPAIDDSVKQLVGPPGASDLAGDPASSDEVDLSHLFETRHVGVEAAAVRSEPSIESPAEVLPPPTSLEAEPARSAVNAPRAGVASEADGLISEVPGRSNASASNAPETVPGDHDGLTISPAALAALRSGTPSSLPNTPAGVAGPQLQAVACPSGHLNPPHAARCRTCGVPIVDRSIRVVARPTLGFLAFDGGMVADIDRPLLIGRKPTTEAFGPGEEVPALVVLPDPEGSISRVHAEIRIEGWEVLVVDRQSTNGTVVEIPGQPPVALRPLEPCLISPGTRIRFGDVAGCSFQTGPR